MKALLLIATVLGLASPSVAADMQLKAPARPLVVADTWTGLYVGLQGGWNLGSFSPVFGTGVAATEVNLDDNSPFVGGHIGYLVQSGGLVIGPEFGVQYWGFKSQAELVPAVGVIPAVSLQQKIDWLAYANVRVGITPFSGTLLYVTGGAAWAHARGEFINLAAIDTSFEQSVLGWNAGLGLEFKLGVSGWSLGGEYRHYDFGKVQSANPVFNVMGIAGDKMTVDQAMGRLSYRLN